MNDNQQQKQLEPTITQIPGQSQTSSMNVVSQKYIT